MNSYFDDKYLDVEQALFPSRENAPKNDTKTNYYAVRDIQSVPDYLHAITDILSNRYIIGLDDHEITNFENAFTLPDGLKFKDMLNRGIFFRGESALYKYQMPGLFRNLGYVEHENDLIDEIEITSAEKLENRSLFDKLTIMQHYGSPTRILDITSNALIALYFAVSSDFNNDGYIYLLSAIQTEHDIKIKTPNDLEVIVKSVIGKLTFSQKELLSRCFDQYRDSDCDIREKISRIHVNDKKRDKIKNAVDKLYLLVEKEMKVTNVTIPINYMFGVNFVKPYRIDPRVEHQSSAFLIFGLEKLDVAQEITEERIQKDDELQDLNNLYKRAVEDEDYAIGGTAFKSLSQIKERKKEIFENSYISQIQEYVNHQVYRLSILYSPTFGDRRSGQARLRIKSKYKRQILDELALEGINGSMIYPDITHKIENIRNENSYIEYDDGN